MPRRRDPLKTRAIPVLLRDAQPTWREIDGEPNERKQQERRHARDAATDTLMRMHRDAEERDALARLDPRIRNFVADLKTRNRMLHRKRLPKPKGGRPFGDRERRLRLAIEIFISEFEQGPAIFGQGVLRAPSSSPQLSVCAIK